MRLARFNKRTVLTLFGVCTAFAGETSTVPSSFAAAEGSTMEAVVKDDSNRSHAPNVAVISIPGLSFMEVKDWVQQPQAFPHLKALLERSGVGAMNVRVPGKGMEDVYLSWGAGAPAQTSTELQLMRGTDRIHGEKAAELYRRLTGSGIDTTKVSLLAPNMQEAVRKNRSSRWLSTPGSLGNALAAAGVKAAVWGNADTGSVVSLSDLRARRFAGLLVADEYGQVPVGNTGKPAVVADSQMAFGITTNYSYLAKEWETFRRTNTNANTDKRIGVMELGDWYRLSEEQESYEPARLMEMKSKVFQELDGFVSQLMGGMNPDDELWLLSPAVQKKAAKAKYLLAPVIRYKPDGAAELLTSDTTRRAGVVSFADLAPSLLEGLKVDRPIAAMGFGIQAVPDPNPLGRLLAEVDTMKDIYVWRPTVLYSLAVFEVAGLLLALAAVWWFTAARRGSEAPLPQRAAAALQLPLLFMLLAAPMLLALGYASGTAVSMLVRLAVALGAAAGLSLVLTKLSRERLLPSLAWIGLSGAGLMLWDGFHDAAGMKASLLGYDPMIGARYYGMGNEYMGALLGSGVLGLSAALQLAASRRRGPVPAAALGVRVARAAAAPPHALIAAACGTLVAGYLASPALGTNAGGAIAACVAFGLLALQLHRGGSAPPLRWGRLALALALLVAAALAALWLLSFAVPLAPRSHISAAFGRLAAGDLAAIWAIISRKLEMNLHLIGVSAWSKVLMTAIFAMAVMLLRPRGLLRDWQRRYPCLMHGFAAGTVGALAALAFNDSGIVAAATMIIYIAAPMLLLRLHEISGGSAGRR